MMDFIHWFRDVVFLGFSLLKCEEIFINEGKFLDFNKLVQFLVRILVKCVVYLRNLESEILSFLELICRLRVEERVNILLHFWWIEECTKVKFEIQILSGAEIVNRIDEFSNAVSQEFWTFSSSLSLVVSQVIELSL